MMAKLNKNLELKKAINDYCQKKGISKNELSVQIGINPAYLSKIENEKFDEITGEVLTKIRAAINLRTAPDVFQTSDLASVFNQCEQARRYKLMTGLTGDTGMGKTTSLKAYSMRENVFFITVDKAMSAKRLFLSILKTMGIQFDGNVYEVVQKIADELNRLESPLLIIDEAGKLSHLMILYLHDLREYTLTNCGILLSGMPYFRWNLQKFADRQKEGCAEFLRRINTWHELKGLNRKEVEVICTENSITGDLKPYYGMRFADLMNRILVEQTLNNKL